MSPFWEPLNTDRLVYFCKVVNVVGVMGRKGINKGHKEKWRKNHIQILNYLRDNGLREKRGKSEMAKDLRIARSTLNEHLKRIPRDKLYVKIVEKEKRFRKEQARLVGQGIFGHSASGKRFSLLWLRP